MSLGQGQQGGHFLLQPTRKGLARLIDLTGYSLLGQHVKSRQVGHPGPALLLQNQGLRRGQTFHRVSVSHTAIRAQGMVRATSAQLSQQLLQVDCGANSSGRRSFLSLPAMSPIICCRLLSTCSCPAPDFFWSDIQVQPARPVQVDWASYARRCCESRGCCLLPAAGH